MNKYGDEQRAVEMFLLRQDSGTIKNWWPGPGYIIVMNV